MKFERPKSASSTRSDDVSMVSVDQVLVLLLWTQNLFVYCGSVGTKNSKI